MEVTLLSVPAISLLVILNTCRPSTGRETTAYQMVFASSDTTSMPLIQRDVLAFLLPDKTKLARFATDGKESTVGGAGGARVVKTEIVGRGAGFPAASFDFT